MEKIGIIIKYDMPFAAMSVFREEAPDLSGTDGQRNKNSRRPGRNGQSGRVLESLALVMQFGIHMLVPIFMCLFLGIWIDRRAGTSYWVIILFFMGALAGFTNVYKLAMKISGKNSGTRRKETDRNGDGKQNEQKGI